MQPLILIGPAIVAERRRLVSQLVATVDVECIDGREDFRRAVRLNEHSVIVLYQCDAEGIPNEPLLRYCLERRRRGIVYVSTGSRVRLPAIEGNAARHVSQYLLKRYGDPVQVARLAAFIAATVAERRAVHALARPLAEMRSRSITN
jgi:hypothetical protein